MEDQLVSVGLQTTSTPLVPVCDPVASFGCLVSSGRRDRNFFTHVADVLPLTAHCDSNTERLWYRNDSILARFWSPNDGVGIDDIRFEDDSDGADANRHHLTYGEVTPLGVRQLAYEMGIANCEDGEDRRSRFDNDGAEYKNDDDDGGIVFYDLGSGVGRLVTQMYIDQPDRVTKAIGIELAEGRHTIGANALHGIMLEDDDLLFGAAGPFEEACNDGGATARCSSSVQLIHGDATEVELDPATTHVFISSLCLPATVLLAIQEKLLRLPNLRAVAALNRLDRMIHGDEWRERDVPIQMSWGASAAKIYHKVA